jgi:hypothetical protein
MTALLWDPFIPDNAVPASPQSSKASSEFFVARAHSKQRLTNSSVCFREGALGEDAVVLNTIVHCFRSVKCRVGVNCQGLGRWVRSYGPDRRSDVIPLESISNISDVVKDA